MRRRVAAAGTGLIVRVAPTFVMGLAACVAGDTDAPAAPDLGDAAASTLPEPAVVSEPPDGVPDQCTDEELACFDVIDNDCDGRTDCVDIDCNDDRACVDFCLAISPLERRCADGLDDDCDALIDCEDADCLGLPACIGCDGFERFCLDGFDNDCDGFVDFQDPDCAGVRECDERNIATTTEALCDDGADNDCDRLVDCQDDDCRFQLECRRQRGTPPDPGIPPPN